MGKYLGQISYKYTDYFKSKRKKNNILQKKYRLIFQK